MMRDRKRIEPRLRSLLAVSLGIHLVMYYLLAVFHFSFPLRPEEPVYYVDISSIPVANPRHGTSAPAATAPPQSAAEPEMKQPAPPSEKTTPKAAAEPAKIAPKQAETAREFEERMAKMARDAEARHADAALKAMRDRVAAGNKGPQGMPTGTGTESGSSYPAYIQSRLADAFRQTIAYQSSNPETAVRLTIDGNGRIIGLKIERSSRDQVFENAVRRAIALAETNFRPPPDGKRFEIGFVFRPQGVGVGKQ
jgi:colicin import membrane protein